MDLTLVGKIYNLMIIRDSASIHANPIVTFER